MNIAWLLFRHSGKNNRNRLALTAAAVALGVLMVLVFAAGVNALMNRGEHSNWRLNFFNNQATTRPIEGIAPLKVSLALDGNLNKYQDTRINTVAMYATGDTSPQLTGMPTPKPGEYYVSPGLEKIIREHPNDNIGQRFGDKQIGVIPDEYVVSPDSLDVVRGMSADETDNPRISSIYRFNAVNGISSYSGMTAILLFIGAAILFVPIIIFLTIATQLGSVQREQRYAALRLIGATRRQVTQIILFESLAAALIGVAIGTATFLLVLPLLNGYYFDGMRFWPSDITVSTTQYISIIVTVLLLCAVANWWGMHHVQLSPLGVARRAVRNKRPHIIRLAPLIIGIGIYAWMATAGKSWVAQNAEDEIALVVLMAGIMSIMLGLLSAGPYLTRLIAKQAAKHTRNASMLIATKRIETQFKPVFRSVSGVVLALFAGSFYLTAVSGIADYTQKAVSNNGYSQLKPDTALVFGAALPADFGRQLAGLNYVTSVQPTTETEEGSAMPCDTLTQYTKLSCDGKNGYAIVNFDMPVVKHPIIVQAINDKNASGYIVALSSNDHIEKLRSFVATQTPHALSNPDGTYVVSGTYAQKAVLNPLIKEFAGLAYVGIGVTLFIAIASLMVSTVGGLLERKRSFATLRLGGMNVKQMKQTVVIESLIPLLSTSLLSAGIGCWIGYVFIASLGSSLQVVLQPSYFAIVGGSLIVAAVAIYSVLPMLDKLTRPESNQTE